MFLLTEISIFTVVCVFVNVDAGLIYTRGISYVCSSFIVVHPPRKLSEFIWNVTPAPPPAVLMFSVEPPSTVKFRTLRLLVVIVNVAPFVINTSFVGNMSISYPSKLVFALEIKIGVITAP